MPPVAPFQGVAVTSLPRVALEYCGTRTTWKVCCPAEAVAAELAYAFTVPVASCSVPPALLTLFAATANS